MNRSYGVTIKRWHMATFQKLRSRLLSLGLTISTAFNTLVFFFSFLAGLAITPIAFFSLLLTITAICLGSRLYKFLSMPRLRSMTPIRQSFYKLRAQVWQHLKRLLPDKLRRSRTQCIAAGKLSGLNTQKLQLNKTNS